MGRAPLRAVLFDYGHTLVDFFRTEEALYAAYEQIRGRIEAVGYMEMPEVLDIIERVARGVDRIVQASYEDRRLEEIDLLQIFGESLESIGFTLPADLVEHIVAIDHSAFSNSLAVKPGTIATLEGLRADGYALGIVSNAHFLPKLMREDLDRLGLAPYFGSMTFSSEVGWRKPDARIFKHVLDELGVPGAEAAFVGDRLVDDIAGAQGVGMRGILTQEFRREVPTEDPGPDAIIESLDELPRVLSAWT